MNWLDSDKQHPSPEIAINSRPLDYRCIDPDYQILLPDFLADYPHAIEEMDPSFPDPFGPVLQASILVDSDHGRDKKDETLIDWSYCLCWLDTSSLALKAPRQHCL